MNALEKESLDLALRLVLITCMEDLDVKAGSA